MTTKQRITTFIAGAALLTLTIPAQAANKDMVQLQTQVQMLQEQMTGMQRNFDERMGVMKSLSEQNTDTMNKLAASIDKLQTIIQKQQADTGTRGDQFSGQIQSLNDSIDELKARLGKVSKQLEDLLAAQQTLAAQTAQSAQAAQAVQQQQQAPPPDVLYNNGLRDYNAGKMDLAAQEFQDAVKGYASRSGPQSDALVHFKDTQQEVVLKTPLRASEMIALTGASSPFDDLCDRIGVPDSQRDQIFKALIDDGSYVGEVQYIDKEATQRVVTRSIQRLYVVVKEHLERQGLSGAV